MDVPIVTENEEKKIYRLV